MRHPWVNTAVLGMGCSGAFPALVRAGDAVTARPDGIALVLALDLCSLHLQFDDSLENIVASALFADGAAPAAISRRDNPAARDRAPKRRPRYPFPVDSATHCDYQTFDHMAFHVTDHGFEMKISAHVPNVLPAKVNDVLDRLLAPHSLKTSDVRFWGVHPGSAKLLDHIQECFALDPSALDFSRAVLRSYGNMSSPTILFVLDEIVRSGNPGPGDYGVLMGFGPGLTIESALVQW